MSNTYGDRELWDVHQQNMTRQVLYFQESSEGTKKN